MTGYMQDIILLLVLVTIGVGAIRWIYKTLRFVMAICIIGAFIYGIDAGFDVLFSNAMSILK